MQTSKINELLDAICQNLGGDWLLTGGSLIQLQISDVRSTEDIDIIKISHPELSETLAQNELFKTAISIGLSAENVNSAAAFFIHQLPGWEQELILLRSGKKGKIFRPNLTLFVALKLGRGTEIDLQDIKDATDAWGVGEFSIENFQRMVSSTVLKRFETLRKSWAL